MNNLIKLGAYILGAFFLIKVLSLGSPVLDDLGSVGELAIAILFGYAVARALESFEENVAEKVSDKLNEKKPEG